LNETSFNLKLFSLSQAEETIVVLLNLSMPYPSMSAFIRKCLISLSGIWHDCIYAHLISKAPRFYVIYHLLCCNRDFCISVQHEFMVITEHQVIA